MPSLPKLDADVIVIGGGPVGSTAALKLAQSGLRTIVLEARSGTSLEERATTFHPPTLEMLDSIGLASPLIERGLIAREYQFRDARLGKIVELDFGILAGDTRYPFRLQCEQSVMTRMALDALEAHPSAELHVSSPVSAVRAQDGFVEVDVVAGGRQGTLRARHVIGADGMKSVTRESLGIEFSGHTYPERFLVIATTTDLQQLMPDIAYVNYVADPVDWHVLMRNPTGWRILFPAPLDEGTDADVLHVTNIEEHLARVIPDHDRVSRDRVSLYQVHRKVAERLREGSVYLVGDAAHVNNPMGGMGMNSGVHDGMLLADLLIAGADYDALDAWAAARRSVALDFVGKETDGNWSALRDTDEERRRVQREAWQSLDRDDDARHAYLMRSSMLASLRG